MTKDLDTLITENQELTRKVQHLEMLLKMDELTGVNSQREFIRICDRRQSTSQYIVVAFDLINFGEYNKVYGHHEGDKALRMFADRLKDVFRFSDYIYRRGGDEFVAILKVSDSPYSLDEIKQRLQTSRVFELAYVGFAEGCGYVQEMVIEAFADVEKQKRNK